jgi:hypothetical protein
VFDRYTEAARRLIFHARSEAMACGSPVIETEHFLLALLKEDTSVLRRMLPADATAIVEKELRESLPSGPPNGQTDAPLSQDMKRVLAYGAEAAERMGDPHIDSVHHLLGLLRVENCAASRVLNKHGITAQRVLRETGARDGAGIESPRPQPTRETLNALVASLPEGAMEQASRALERLQTWPPRPPERIAEIQKEMRERFKASVRPGQGMMGGGGGGWSTDAQGRLPNGSFSSGRIEDGVRVTETHRFFEGHEITIVERVRIQPEKKLLAYSQQIHLTQINGPNREHRFDVDFEIE